MPREQVHYEGRLIELPPRILPGGGWLDLDMTWRGPDGTRHAIAKASVSADNATVGLRRQGGRGWRVTVSNVDPVSRPTGQRRRRTARGELQGKPVTLLFDGHIDGEWHHVARQVVYV